MIDVININLTASRTWNERPSSRAWRLLRRAEIPLIKLTPRSYRPLLRAGPHANSECSAKAQQPRTTTLQHAPDPSQYRRARASRRSCGQPARILRWWPGEHGPGVSAFRHAMSDTDWQPMLIEDMKVGWWVEGAGGTGIARCNIRILRTSLTLQYPSKRDIPGTNRGSIDQSLDARPGSRRAVHEAPVIPEYDIS